MLSAFIFIHTIFNIVGFLNTLYLGALFTVISLSSILLIVHYEVPENMAEYYERALDRLKIVTEKLEEGKNEIEKSIDIGKEYYNRGTKKILNEYLVEPYLKKPMSAAIQNIAVYTEWSVFDWMCLIFDFKRVALRVVDLLEIFMYTDSPEQARKVILQ